MGIHDKYTSIDCFWKDVRYVIDKSDRNGDTQVNLFSLRINDSVEYDNYSARQEVRYPYL